MNIMIPRESVNNMRDRDVIKKLKCINYINLSILAIAAVFLIFGDNFIVGILIMLFSYFLDWKFYRCPHCNKHLDTKIKLNAEICCSYCTKVISQPS